MIGSVPSIRKKNEDMIIIGIPMLFSEFIMYGTIIRVI